MNANIKKCVDEAFKKAYDDFMQKLLYGDFKSNEVPIIIGDKCLGKFVIDIPESEKLTS